MAEISIGANGAFDFSPIDFQLISECSRRFHQLAAVQCAADRCMADKCECMVSCIESISLILRDDIPSLLQSLRSIEKAPNSQLGSAGERDSAQGSPGGQKPPQANLICEVAMRFRQSAADIDSKVQAIRAIEFAESQPNLIEKRNRLVEQFRAIIDTWERFAVSIATATVRKENPSRFAEVVAEQQCFLKALEAGRAMQD